MLKNIRKECVFYFVFIFSEGNYFTESIGVILTGVCIDIVGIDVDIILHVGFLEGGWGVIARIGILWIASW